MPRDRDMTDEIIGVIEGCTQRSVGRCARISRCQLERRRTHDRRLQRIGEQGLQTPGCAGLRTTRGVQRRCDAQP